MTRDDVLRDKCREFHRRNPRVWKLFCRFALERIARGYQHYSADAVMHRVRWETDAGDATGFKISNSYVAYYARAFMRTYPEHDGFFRTRTRPSEYTDA